MGAPWRVALGPAVDRLEPALADYFAPIPPGRVGVGQGTFDVLGTPRRLLHLPLRLAGPSIFPVWAEGVPFTIRNTGVPGLAAVRAERRVVVAGRTLTMHDEIGSPGPGVVVDLIGAPPRLEVAFRAEVEDGGLLLVSTGVALRLGRLRLPLGVCSPRVTLSERIERGRQRVSLTVDAPVIGRIYEYAGSFTYRIEETS